MFEALAGPPVRIIAWLYIAFTYPFVRYPIWRRKRRLKREGKL